MKKAHVIPVHKGDVQLLWKNYKPLLLLPKWMKYFEIIVYRSLITWKSDLEETKAKWNARENLKYSKYFKFEIWENKEWYFIDNIYLG